MPILELKTELSYDDLVKAAAQLESPDLDRFVDEVAIIRARRRAPALSKEESELLLKINEGIPEDLWQRYHALIIKRDADALTPEEYPELLSLSDQMEEFQARQLERLAALARLRGVSLEKVMHDLGIQPRSHD